ncbi:probable inactive 1-aminocyclopropane-1-carboxylate synthase-like protein 2 [Pteronotus mesoamericanus]|uniref:probable inactive 1-aminocyclopropane-1-carboxylate synthase-like protein 2 n=1 Tax=Pteronotus mesoamericanus TaxID=1884717 RepID=UPI0023EDE712|nr:probable inactive 1-aminocyclopropane-1-carboxylate synthase-like protein 2 [Pteronotus parnellii mesoamericanus]
MSLRSDTLHKPCGQMKGQGLGTQIPDTQLMELILRLQKAIEDYVMQLETRRLWQDVVPEEGRHNEATKEQKASLIHSMYQVVNLLQSGATGGPELPLSRLSLDSSGDVGGRHQAQSSRQPDELSYQLNHLEAAFVSNVLSNHGNDITASYSSFVQTFVTYLKDNYDEDKNTSGFINLSITENKLCTGLITERLSQSDMNYIDDTLLQYSDYKGQANLREEVARFLTDYCKAPAPLDPENVVVVNACLPVFSALSMVLCDPGEAFLVPSPSYPGFSLTAHLYSKVELIYVHLNSEVTAENSRLFQLTVGKLENALHEAQLKGQKVKGLMLINPQNPLGDVYSRDSLKEYLEFAKRHTLHVIVDEIYLETVFDESITFHSVLSLESLPDPNRTHLIWGTGKLFGSAGFHLGALYTYNKEVASAVSIYGILHSIPGIIQHRLCRLLQDREWIDKVYLPTKHSRLQAAHRYVTSELKALKVPFFNCGAGLNVWMNLKEYLEPCTFEKELLLHQRFLDHKLVLSPGKFYMYNEPGWFRLTYSNKMPHLKVAMHRFSRALAEQKQALAEK